MNFTDIRLCYYTKWEQHYRHLIFDPEGLYGDTLKLFKNIQLLLRPYLCTL
jgi:hypothetical protein